MQEPTIQVIGKRIASVVRETEGTTHSNLDFVQPGIVQMVRSGERCDHTWRTWAAL